MLKWKQLIEREVYKQAKYVKYVDENGKEVKEEKAIKIAPILLINEMDDGGLLVKLWICDKMPKGFKVLKGALTAPNGFCWVYNGKSLFDDNRRKALLKK